MRIGARVWKTALAVAVAIGISRLVGLHHPVFAGVAAIICMQPTIAGSVRRGVERMQATIIGAAFSLLALIALEHVPALQTVRPALVGLTVLVVMIVTIRLGWLDSLVLAAATVVVIMVLPPEENIYYYSLSRTGVTFIGIVVATVVNAVFVTPRYSDPLWQKMGQLVQATSPVYRQAVEAFRTRDADLALQAQESLAQGDELLKAVATTVEWMEEDAALRKTIRWPYGREVESLRRAVELMTLTRQSTATILRVTTEILQKNPQYAEHDAPVYGILWELAQLSFKSFDRVELRLSGMEVPESCRPAWTEDTHMLFVRGIREGHRDIYPLIEISVVQFEIRRVTEMLCELDDSVAALMPNGR